MSLVSFLFTSKRLHSNQGFHTNKGSFERWESLKGGTFTMSMIVNEKLYGLTWLMIYGLLNFLRILLQNCPIFRFRPSSQLWHPSFSPLYDVFNLTTHVFSESLWHVLFTDAPVMTMKKTHANTKTKTKTMTKTKWQRPSMSHIFENDMKDIKSDDESVMHH